MRSCFKLSLMFLVLSFTQIEAQIVRNNARYRPGIIADSLRISLKGTALKGDKKAAQLFYQLGLPFTSADTASLRFSPSGEMILNWNSGTGPQLRVFQGKFRKTGVYEIYLSRINIQIPPLIPFIYSKSDVWRIRMKWISDKEVEVSYYQKKGSSCLVFMSAGARSYGSARFKASY